MQVLIVDDDITRQTDLSLAFMEAGLHTSGTGSHAVAERCIRKGWIDLVVMAERVSGRLTHPLALLAEWRNPLVATILLTPRHGQDMEELFLLLPSLHCLLAPETEPELVTKLSLASVISTARRMPPMVLTPDQMVADAQDVRPVFASRRAPMRAVTPVHVAPVPPAAAPMLCSA